MCSFIQRALDINDSGAWVLFNLFLNSLSFGARFGIVRWWLLFPKRAYGAPHSHVRVIEKTHESVRVSKGNHPKAFFLIEPECLNQNDRGVFRPLQAVG